MAAESKQKIVALFDTRIPRRHVERCVIPLLADAEAGFIFLNNSNAQCPAIYGTCNNLEDSELVVELIYRYQKKWLGMPCFFFTADRKFYLENHAVLRRSDIILILVPLFGKFGATPRKKVIKILINTIVPVLQKAHHWRREYGENAVSRLKARFCRRNKIRRPQ